MIIEYKTIELFGKVLFEKVTLTTPFRKPNPMLNEACFLYIIEGEYNSISGLEKLRVRQEESVLMKCGQYLSQMFGSGTRKYQAVAVHFYPDILRKIYDNQLPAFLTASPARNCNAGMGKLGSDTLINKYIEGILFYFKNPSLVNEEILILKLKEIVLLLNQTQNAPAIHSILANLFNPTSYALREIVESHIYSNLTLSELARLSNKSLASFKREFRKVYQVAPATYIRNKKLAKARQVLALPAVRITDVAYDCGFSDIAHFSKLFKQRFGLSPTDWRLSQIDKSLS